MLLTIDEATIYVEETYIDEYGNETKKPSSAGVKVRCMISAVESTRRARAGGARQEVSGGWVFQSPDAPLGRWSRVVWRGRAMTVTNGPLPVGPVGSPTHHVAALLIEER